MIRTMNLSTPGRNGNLTGTTSGDDEDRALEKGSGGKGQVDPK